MRQSNRKGHFLRVNSFKASPFTFYMGKICSMPMDYHFSVMHFFLLLLPYLDLYTKYFADSFCLSEFIGLCICVFLNLPLCLLWSIRFVASSGNDVMLLLVKEYENNYSWNCALIFF